MGAKRPSASHADDIGSLCRRLAAALQGGRPILCALDDIAERTPSRLRPALRAIRERLRGGGRISEALADLGAPSFIWGTVRSGEASARLAQALTLLADRLEAEKAIRPARNRTLHYYALAFGRLGMMLSAGVPILSALEAAGESLGHPGVGKVFIGLTREMKRGWGEFADAVGRLAPELPPMAVEMLRDGERDGRLDVALPIVADYLLDEASQRPAPARK